MLSVSLKGRIKTDEETKKKVRALAEKMDDSQLVEYYASSPQTSDLRPALEKMILGRATDPLRTASFYRAAQIASVTKKTAKLRKVLLKKLSSFDSNRSDWLKIIHDFDTRSPVGLIAREKRYGA